MKLEAIDVNHAALDWTDVARDVGDTFAARAAQHDQDGEFVARNYADLKTRRLFSAGVPSKLGGGGASHADVCAIVRELGRHCGSTGLSYAMHSHPVCVNVFKHIRGDAKATGALGKIAANELVIAGTGANDWLASNGEAIEVDGGYRVNAHKRFVSGGPGADLFVTSAIFDGDDGPEVIHFAVPMARGCRSAPTGRNLASHVGRDRARGITDHRFLLRRARRIRCHVRFAKRIRETAPHQAPAIGQMQSEIAVAQMALEDMIRIVDNYAFTPDLSITSDVLARKAIAARSVKAAIETASEIAGGPGFYRGHPMERIVRDMRAFHFHPLPERIQQEFSGRIALGLDPIEAR
jgi:alkylation response protein AidB-like acyl-CoA dehydrogenase